MEEACFHNFGARLLPLFSRLIRAVKTIAHCRWTVQSICAKSNQTHASTVGRHPPADRFALRKSPETKTDQCRPTEKWPSKRVAKTFTTDLIRPKEDGCKGGYFFPFHCFWAATRKLAIPWYASRNTGEKKSYNSSIQRISFFLDVYLSRSFRLCVFFVK